MASFNKFPRDSKKTLSGRRMHGAPAYDKWRRDDLYHLAAQKGIEDRAKMTNEELAHALRQAQSGGE